MGAFPCPLERTVAAALLLLASSSKAPSPSSNSPGCCFDDSSNCNYAYRNEDSSPSDSKSCSSSLTSEASSKEIPAYPLSVLAEAARFHAIMKLKVVRKSRSKKHRNSNDRKKIWGLWRKSTMITPAPVAETAETSSLSSASTIDSGAPSRRLTLIRVGKDWLGRGEAHRRQKDGTTSMWRRAEAILKFLSVGCASEVRIRRVLGDSPDTSKALRMLLKRDEVKRSGAGGRTDPFVYTVMQCSRFTLNRKAARSPSNGSHVAGPRGDVDSA